MNITIHSFHPDETLQLALGGVRFPLNIVPSPTFTGRTPDFIGIEIPAPSPRQGVRCAGTTARPIIARTDYAY